MEFRPDGSLALDMALSMSLASEDALPREVAETARLVQLTLGGDSAAFEQIVLRHETRVMNLAARLLGSRDEASDVAQEVFLRAFKYLHRLDVDKPMEPWLLRITVNVCRDAARGRQRRHALIDGEAAEAAATVDQSTDPYEGLAHKEERLMLRKGLETLPEKERLALLLRDVEGLSTAEVAQVLQSSETTVRSQVSRGRLRLKEAIDRLVGDRQ
jgi:RNA polymerase sigma factor (sigma-70 family)